MITPAYNIAVHVGGSQYELSFPKIPSIGEYFRMIDKFWRVESVILQTQKMQGYVRREFDIWCDADIVVKEVSYNEAFLIGPEIGKWVRE